MHILLACHFSDPGFESVNASDPAISIVEARMYAEPKETGSGDTGGADSPAESGGDTSPADTDSGTDSGTESGTDSGADSGADSSDSAVGRVGKSAAELAGEPGGFGCSAIPAGWRPAAWTTGLLALGLLLRRRG